MIDNTIPGQDEIREIWQYGKIAALETALTAALGDLDGGS